MLLLREVQEAETMTEEEGWNPRPESETRHNLSTAAQSPVSRWDLGARMPSSATACEVYGGMLVR